MNWFHNATCGVFFHWGPYSVAARGEWVMNRERIPPEEYRTRYIDAWRAEAYDPDEWMKAAKALGASYVVLTTRHHDGFALWNSRVNPNNAVKLGPGRDLVADFVDAARRADLAVGFYYSIANWTHPDYPGAFRRDWPLEDDWQDEAALERFQAYNLKEMEELMSGYGRIDYLWYDGGEPKNIRNPGMNELARRLQPGILINKRNSPDGEISIMEQGFSSSIPDGPWEACFTLNRNWGYHAGDDDYKSPVDLIQMLCTTAANGGKLLLNIGPDGAGRIPPQSMELMERCGSWIRSHPQVLSQASPSPFTWNNSCTVTTAGSSVFLHFTQWPGGDFCWAETNALVREIFCLPDEIPLHFKQQGARIFIKTSAYIPPVDDLTTIELKFDEAPRPATGTSTFWIPDS